MSFFQRPVRWLCYELGLVSLWETGMDAWLVIIARTCRMFAFGAISLIIALFLSALHFADFKIGLFMTLTLVGDVIISLVMALFADRVGRRRILLIGGLLMVLSGAVFSVFENYWILLGAAVVGVISATGGDFGPFRSVEESTLSHLTTPDTRSDVLSWYVTTSTLGSSVGTEVSGRLVDFLQRVRKQSLVNAYHLMFWVYIIMGLLTVFCALLMSRKCEAATPPPDQDTKATEPLLAETSREGQDGHPSLLTGAPPAATTGSRGDTDEGEPRDVRSPERPRSTLRRIWESSRFAQVSPDSRSVVIRLWILLTIDSLADGMVSYALTNYYLARKFDLSESYRGDILSISYLLMSISTIFAGPLARHLGLVNTMVFTHLPSSLAVLLFPMPQSVDWTVALLFIRTGLNNMDQGPRAAFIAAVVKPQERTAVMGITGMLRTLASTVGPSLTGFLAGTDRFWIAFVVAGALRIGYDLGLFFQFIGIKLHAHEEDGGEGQVDESRLEDEEADRGGAGVGGRRDDRAVAEARA